MKNVGFNTLTLHNRLYLFFSHEISAVVEFNRDKGRELVKYLSNDLRSVSARHGLRRKRYFLRQCRRDVALKGDISLEANSRLLCSRLLPKTKPRKGIL